MPQQECNDNSKLGKVFGVFDLTALGVSATLGVGVYVLAGHVAKGMKTTIVDSIENFFFFTRPSRAKRYLIISNCCSRIFACG